MIRQRLQLIRENIESVCRKIGRDPAEITLVAATKYATLAQIRAAIESGLTDIGESKVQDAQQKFAELGTVFGRVKKHMIGHLQTNKVKTALEIFDLIQSVDSTKLVLEIEKRADELQRSVEILIEVNTSEEPQKFGARRHDTVALVDEIRRCRHVSLKGLMTIAPYTDDEQLVRRSFRQLKDLSDEIKTNYRSEENICMQYLSMGMTHDYALALAEGANMLRIGSAIFAG